MTKLAVSQQGGCPSGRALLGCVHGESVPERRAKPWLSPEEGTAPPVSGPAL